MIRIISFFAALFIVQQTQAQSYVEKTMCAEFYGFNGGQEFRKHLLEQAKISATSQLFGEFIKSTTLSENSSVSVDEVTLITAGRIRIQGSPSFYNSEDFAKGCIQIKFSATAEDFALFDPVSVTRKVCLSDDKLTTKALKVSASNLARRKAIVEFEPALEAHANAQLFSLLRRVRFSEQGFIDDTETYCTRVNGFLLPAEVLAFSARDIAATEIKQKVEDKSIFEMLKKKYYGDVTQPGSRSYSIEVARNGEKIEVFYPELRCGGEWSLKSDGVDVARFEENIQHGGGCVLRGDVVLTRLADNKLRFEWSRKGNSRVLAFSSMSPRK